jgi:hypothetical protein
MSSFCREIKYDCGCIYRFIIKQESGYVGPEVDFCDKHLKEFMTFYEFMETIGKGWELEERRRYFKLRMEARKS